MAIPALRLVSVMAGGSILTAGAVALRINRGVMASGISLEEVAEQLVAPVSLILGVAVILVEAHHLRAVALVEAAIVLSAAVVVIHQVAVEAVRQVVAEVIAVADIQVAGAGNLAKIFSEYLFKARCCGLHGSAI